MDDQPDTCQVDRPVFHQIDPGRTQLYRAITTAVYWATGLGIITWTMWAFGWLP